MKIHIIGCSGSGKTYLAEVLAKKYKIPHFDLDDIQWDNSTPGYGVKMPREKRAALLQEILTCPDWIIEGVYYAWVQQSFEDADRIYVLDMPKYLYVSRILLRFAKRKLGMEKGKKESIQSVCKLLKWTETFQKQNSPEIRKLLEQYGDKVIWLSSKEDIQKTIDAPIQI